MALYDGGASFQGGALKVTDTGIVENLNVTKLQNETPASFIKTSSAASGASGISQNGNALTMINETINIDTASTIKIGNLIIKSADNGNGILIGKV